MDACSSFCFSPLLIGKLGAAAFFAILFLQSGYDKLNDWNGNLTWIKGYFEKSPFKKITFPLLATLTILELASGLFAAAGIVTTFTCHCQTYLTWAMMLSGASLLSLFLGNRIAKDYSSAASMGGYFAVWIGWVILMSL